MNTPFMEMDRNGWQDTGSPLVPRNVIAIRHILIGLLPFIVACFVHFVWMIMSSESRLGVITSTVALHTITLLFAFYALTHYPSPRQLPFVWVMLMLTEFMAMPIMQSIRSAGLPGDDMPSGDVLVRAHIACILFVCGLWLGMFVAQSGRQTVSTVRRGNNLLRRQTTGSASLMIVIMAALSLATQVYVYLTSGLSTFDLADARGEGLIGTTKFIPLMYLCNAGTIIASYFSCVESRPYQRWVFNCLAVGSMCVGCVFPILTGRRYEVLEAVVCLALPKLTLMGDGGVKKVEKWACMLLPLIVCMLIAGNTLTSAIRGVLTDSRASLGETVEMAMSGSHFSHVWLLAKLIENGVDKSGFAGLYEGIPALGDALILLPRNLFPDKPVTTGEVINGVMMGDRFVALDRGIRSTYTVSLWVQMYVAGSMLFMLPLAFFYSIITLRVNEWAFRRQDSVKHQIVGCMTWLLFGWIAFNAVLTTVDVPRLILVLTIVHFFFLYQPAGERR